ncbi:hypothetical protein PDJAM_G00250880 [Pangasius djambal]|uniref:Uncharacterized protein n=1 Tax=Pangasius djambal TaxID=1691987 RepID=A0ACC5YIX7_9TELE|nr:hypothetical protein [Pangasius djambal]
MRNNFSRVSLYLSLPLSVRGKEEVGISIFRARRKILTAIIGLLMAGDFGVSTQQKHGVLKSPETLLCTIHS